MARAGSDASTWRVVPLGGEAKVVFRSPDPDKVSLACPSLMAFPGGRLVAAFDQAGPGVKKLQGAKGRDPASNHWLQGKVISSTDHGESWKVCETFPFTHPCLFRDGASLYLLGHRGDLQIMKSSDGGATWGRPVALSSQASHGVYSHSPTSVLACGDYLYMAALKIADDGYRGDPVSVLALEVWRALRGSDLADRRSWSRSEASRPFRDLFPVGRASGTGVPFFRVPDANADQDVGGRRWATRVGWREPHLVHLADPTHIWHNGEGCVLHLLASACTNRGNLGVICKVVDRPGETLRIELERAPSGVPFWMLPLPGGHQKFSLTYDETSSLFWMVSNRCVDSMKRVKQLPDTHAGLPADDRTTLQLSFSRNLVDWQFAGLVATCGDGIQSCCDAALGIRANDLHVVARCASDGRRHADDTDEIRLFSIPHFRDLAY